MMRFWPLGVGCLLLACLLGCPDSASTKQSLDSTDADESAEESVAKTPGQEVVKPKLPILEGVDSLEGNWVLVPNLQGRNLHFWLFRLMPDENDEWTVHSLASSRLFNQEDPGSVKFETEKLAIDGNSIRFTARILNPKAEIKNALIDFEGTLRDGIVSGNVFLVDTGVLAPTRLLPTDADTLADYADFSESEGASEFQKASNEPDPARKTLAAAATRSKSPATLDAYANVFQNLVRWNLSDQEVHEAIAAYRSALENWGPRLEGFALINTGKQLAQARKHIDLAEELLNAGEKLLGDLKIAEPILLDGRLNVRMTRNVQALAGKDEEAAAKAYADTQELLEKQPYHPELLWAVAEYAEKQQKIDDALGYYQTIVAMPLLERLAVGTRLGLLPGDATPRTSLVKLWTAKHGSEEGLREAIAETYDEKLSVVAARIRERADEFPAADAGNRVVLAEVFTNIGCEACIAADLALDILHESLPPSELIVLNYHNHVPMPDPLTSFDAEERSTLYRVQGSPTAFINGANLERVGGFFMPEMIENSYRQFRAAFDHFSKMSTEVTITAAAEASDGMLDVNVSVEGVPENDLADVRLRLALVEENILLAGPNGIRRHSMVVRTMLGGAKGIAAKQGQLKYSLTDMPLAELKDRQLRYLHNYEHGKRTKFPVKPVDLKPLHLVAFVQKFETATDQDGKAVRVQGEVLQAVQVPVMGELVYPDINIDHPEASPLAPAGQKAAAKGNSPPQNDAKSPKEGTKNE